MLLMLMLVHLAQLLMLLLVHLVQLLLLLLRHLDLALDTLPPVTAPKQPRCYVGGIVEVRCRARSYALC